MNVEINLNNILKNYLNTKLIIILIQVVLIERKIINISIKIFLDLKL